MTKIDLGLIKVDDLSYEEAINFIKLKLLKSDIPNVLVTPNAGHLLEIQKNSELKNVYSNAELSLIDGWPIAISAKIAA